MIVHPGNGAITGYNLTRSLRFRASASAYLNRTNTSTVTNNKIWTWSGWVKRGNLGSGVLHGFTDASTLYQDVVLFAADTIRYIIYVAGSSVAYIQTTQVFRDPSAWYHIVVAVDTTQTTASNRFKLYVNGVQVTSFSTATYAPLNEVGYINKASQAQGIGAWYPYNTNNFYDGYLAEVNFIDGQALTPSSFGSTNALTGVWQPARYTSTYGTNGFYLPFTDNSALTTSSNVGLGKDFSGNGNYWTTNNISLTAGLTYDSMTDVPTLTDATTANYAVLNPLSKSVNATLSSANSVMTGYDAVAGTIYVTSGKYYYETYYAGSPPTSGVAIGIIAGNKSLPLATGYPGAVANLWYVYNGGGATATFNSETTATNTTIGAIPVSGNYLQICIDATNGYIWYGQNNVWYDSSGGTTGNPSAGTNPTFTISSPSTRGGFSLFLYSFAAGNTYYSNFGQRPWTYTPPTGAVGMNTYNSAAGTVTTSGSFTGNVSADGPSINLNGVPTAMTINGNAVTFGTHADKTAYGFKVRSSSTSYNSTGTNTYSITTTGAKFKYANAQGNP